MKEEVKCRDSFDILLCGLLVSDKLQTKWLCRGKLPFLKLPREEFESNRQKDSSFVEFRYTFHIPKNIPRQPWPSSEDFFIFLVKNLRVAFKNRGLLNRGY